MRRMSFLIGILFMLMLVSVAHAQEQETYYQLDPNPYDPKVDPDYELFVSNWQESMPRKMFGFVERNILSPATGDPVKPAAKGAVLTDIKSFSHATLEARLTSGPTTLKDEQHIYYVDSGQGTITSKGKTEPLHDGVGVIVPPGVEFTIKNPGDEPLTMYVIKEPIPEGFKPRQDVLVRDTNLNQIGGTTGHWTHITNGLFGQKDGMAVVTGMSPVWYDPMTMGQPHSHGGHEEIWFALEGDITVLLGKKVFKLTPGSAYKIPPDGKTWHSNINASNKPIKMVWFMRNVPGKRFPYADLDSRPYNPATESDIDMYISGWKESLPRNTHGSLIERDVLLRCSGDVLHPSTRGGVLTYMRRFVYATLYAGNETAPTRLKGEQELFYVLSGTGKLNGGGKTFDLYPGVAFLAPENLEFTMKNTSNEPMTFYLVVEPTRPNFRPVDHIVWRDENAEPIHTSTAHWVNNNKWLIKQEEGLADIELLLTVTVMPNTFAQPHSHGKGVEEVWAAIDDGTQFLLGKQIRNLPPGTAYMIPPDDRTPHANFNLTDKPVKLFYFGRFTDK